MKLIMPYLFLFLILVSCNNVDTNKKEGITNEVNSEASLPKTNKTKEVTDMQSSQDDWYMKNVVVSDNNRFKEWSGGEATLKMMYRKQDSSGEFLSLEVGTIASDGQITISLPSTLSTYSKLNSISNLVFYDIQDISLLTYNKGSLGYFANTSLNVVQGGKSIGSVTLGNSVRTTYNLTNQSTLTMGDEGYILFWAYVDEASGLTGTEIRKDKVRRDGTNTIEAETTVTYDLKFKKGWNLVKTEVIGSYDLVHERGLNASWFKKHQHTVINEIPEDASYFFRKRGD